ncbi:hypothetical protein [Methanobrevibacter sp. UBA188]|uniref:hypothetical protein n=1 Tax=Methanobrevibacter sp. UBA188 TaxID=1915473 RepID=UPI0025F0E05F|nr:hypothetical protein [Methanobrevibacter sp. UBA188]
MIQRGYLLDFTDVQFREFVLGTTGINVFFEEYLENVINSMGSKSKGKILIYFIHNGSDSDVCALLFELIRHVEIIYYGKYDIDLKQLNKAKDILNKSKSKSDINL